MEDVLSGGSSNSIVLIGQVCVLATVLRVSYWQIAVAVAVTIMVNARMKKEVHMVCVVLSHTS